MEARFWLILIIVLLVVEFATTGLTTIWFALGALVALGISLVTDNLILQVIFFLLVSTLMLILTRPIAMKYLSKTRTKTNYETLIGKTVVVTKKIDNLLSCGEVVINDVEWMARADKDNTIYLPGEHVIIKEISGVKIIVNKGEEENG